MKNKNIYSYTLRFDKEATPDRQALEKIMQFCDITHMSKHAAMMFMLAAADISALHESIVSLTVIPGRNQEKKTKEKNSGMETEKVNSSVPFKKEVPEIELDSIFDGIFDS